METQTNDALDTTEEVWAYPVGGGEARIVTIPVGGDAPEGYAFEPSALTASDTAPSADVLTPAEQELARRLKVVADDRAQVIEAASERISALETEQAASDKDFEAQREELNAALKRAENLTATVKKREDALAAEKERSGTLKAALDKAKTDLAQAKKGGK